MSVICVFPKYTEPQIRVCLLQYLRFAIPASTYAYILAIYILPDSHKSFFLNAWLLAEERTL